MLRREFIFATTCAAAADPGRTILVATAGSGDYLLAAGGTLAAFIREGWSVWVAQFGNDEKRSTGLSPAQTRLANVEEGKAAGKLLGVAGSVWMDHKSGELGYTSSTEMRQQMFGLIRHHKPRILFIPDPYVTFRADEDQRWVGKMAEEAWGYSGGAMFANDLARMGFPAYGAPEVYYYALDRPYRPGEGGDGRAELVARDISATLEQKITAAELLLTRNRLSAKEVAQRRQRAPGGDAEASRLVREYLTEMAATIGRKHGFQYAEEFNHVGAGEGIPAHALERAVPKR